MKPNRFEIFIKAIGGKEGLLNYLAYYGSKIDPKFFINDKFLEYNLSKMATPSFDQMRDYQDSVNLVFVFLIPTETYTISSRKPRYIGKKMSINIPLKDIAEYYDQKNLLEVLSV